MTYLKFITPTNLAQERERFFASLILYTYAILKPYEITSIIDCAR